MDLLVMARLEARRLGVVQAALEGALTNQQAADRLGLSRDQLRRWKRRVRDQGPGGIVHGNRGRVSPRRLSEAVRKRVVDLLTGEVKLNDHHIADLLAGEGLGVSPASVRRLRRTLRIAPKRRRRPSRHRRRRDRRARRGEMVLIDGSPFAWFAADGPRWTLLGAIDDATGDILALTLRPTEDLHGYLTLMRELFTRHGLPRQLYGDRSGVLIRSDDHWTAEEELAGRQQPTQFGRMLERLGVAFIAATSPQAKGRIERLWATLQDRLAAELRLLGLDTPEAAAAYLPRFIAAHNARRSVAPAEPASDFRSAPRDLDRQLGCTYERVVARDNTVQVAGRWVQVPPGPGRRSYHKARVEVRELLDGRMLVLHPRHGLLVEQASPSTDFQLTNRRGPRSSRINARTDAPGSRQDDERRTPRPRSRPLRTGIGTYTNRRKPKPGHAWKQPFILSPSTRSD